MAYSDSEHRSGGNRNFKPRFSSSRPDLHKATCDNCGKICEVPFKPTGSKPVYCSDCFRKNGDANARSSEAGSSNRPNAENRQMYDAICSQCGNACQIPFQPKPGRDVFCSRCFEKSGDSVRTERRSYDKPSYNRENTPQRSVEVPNYKAQFETLNAKMDKILNLVTSLQITPEPVIATMEAVVEEIAEEKEEAPKALKAKKAAPKKATKTKKTTLAKKK